MRFKCLFHHQSSVLKIFNNAFKIIRSMFVLRYIHILYLMCNRWRYKRYPTVAWTGLGELSFRAERTQTTATWHLIISYLPYFTINDLSCTLVSVISLLWCSFLDGCTDYGKLPYNCTPSLLNSSIICMTFSIVKCFRYGYQLIRFIILTGICHSGFRISPLLNLVW